MTTTFDEEWASLKQGASGDGTRLASAGEDGGTSGKDGVKSDEAAWRQAASSVASLGRGVKMALAELEKGQGGGGFDPAAAIPAFSPAVAGAGVQSWSAQVEVATTWERYLGDVADRCEVLHLQLEKPAGKFAGSDAELAHEFGKLDDGYADTSGAGKDKG